MIWKPTMQRTTRKEAMAALDAKIPPLAPKTAYEVRRYYQPHGERRTLCEGQGKQLRARSRIVAEVAKLWLMSARGRNVIAIVDPKTETPLWSVNV